jgi:hypothetical protein
MSNGRVGSSGFIELQRDGAVAFERTWIVGHRPFFVKALRGSRSGADFTEIEFQQVPLSIGDSTAIPI